jgi:HAD superfamily hydrolase (TIGR01549 family)
MAGHKLRLLLAHASGGPFLIIKRQDFFDRKKSESFYRRLTMRNKPILFFDCGDTIIDEGTEVKDETGVSTDAQLIPGGDVLIRTLGAEGYTMALVADGYADTFKNLLGKYDLYKYFSAFSISEDVGVDKPDARMFQKALEDLQIPREEWGNVWMIGNNLERDIRGANQLGLVSVWLDWAPRRSKTPADKWEVPDHTITMPLEVLDLLKQV